MLLRITQYVHETYSTQYVHETYTTLYVHVYKTCMKVPLYVQYFFLIQYSFNYPCYTNLALSVQEYDFMSFSA